MHCKYCGYALPAKGIVCINCGKTISKEELATQKQNQLTEWDYISNQNTSKYKSEQATEPNRLKATLFIVIILVVLILLAIIKLI